MALTCSRCGAQNPDGNSFCQSCGTPLAAMTAAAPAGPPPGTPPPVFGPPPNMPPPAYQSPYYAPAAGFAPPPAQRAPWMLIIAAVLGLVVIMAGCGTALAVYNNSRNANQASSGGLSGLSSPSPAGTPTPIPSSSPSSGSNIATNPTLSVTVPSGWLVAAKDSETISLVDSNGESATIGSGPSSPAQSAQQNRDTLDQYLSAKYPDTKLCPGAKVTNGSISGAPGLLWQMCFTLTSGSQSVPAAASMFAGANSDSSVYYVVILLAPASTMNSFVVQARPVLASIKWALK